MDGDGEEVNRGVDSSTHPVEKGIELTDTVRKKPIELSLTGKIVDTETQKASATISKLISLMKNGSLIKYTGRNIISNLQIQSFNTNHSNSVWGGCEFDMTLKEIRIASNSYSSNTSQKGTTTTPTTSKISVGSIVIFLGGSVYVSSDAKTPAATRGRSTCRVAHINTASWAIHPYSLISTDGQLVCGWVDTKNIQTTGKTTTNATKQSGTKQVTSGTNQVTSSKNTTSSNSSSGGLGNFILSNYANAVNLSNLYKNNTNNTRSPVYHIVKLGDTVYKLVTVTYKSLNTTCEWVIKNNPNAFLFINQPSTLKVGARLLMGYK